MDYQTLETKRQQLQSLLSKEADQLTPQQKQQLEQLLQDLSSLYQLQPQQLKQLLTTPQPENKPNHIDTALLTQLVVQYQDYQQQLQKPLKDTSLNQDQQDLISYLVHRQQLKIIQEKLAQQLNQTQTQAIKQASTTKPQSDPHQINQDLAQQVISQKIQNQDLQLPAQDTNKAQQTLANDITLLQPDAKQLSILADLSLAQNNSQYQSQSSLYQLNQQITPLVQPAQQPDFEFLFQKPQQYLDTHYSDPLFSTTINTKHLIQTINQDNTKKLLQNTSVQALQKDIVNQNYQSAPQDSPLFDQLNNLKKNNHISLNQLSIHPTTQKIFQQASPESQIDKPQLLSSLRKQNPTLRIFPLQEAEAWASFTENIPDQSQFSPLLIRYLGHGITPQQLQSTLQQAQTQPDHPLYQQVNNNLKFYSSILSNYFNLADTEAGQKLLLQAQKSTLLSKLNPLRNRLLSFFPASSHATVQAIISPVSFLRNKASSFLGKRIFTHLAQNTSHQVLKKGLQTLAQKGFQTGAKELLKKISLQAAEKLGIHIAAEALNVVPGLGVIVDIVITVGTAIIKKIKDLGQNIAVTLYGEKIKKKDLLAPFVMAGSAGIGMMTGLGRALQSAVSATFTAGASALVTLIFSSIAVLLFYVAALNAGPLISTIAQLESGLSAPSFDQAITPYTGPIIEGCAPAWPTVRAYVTQGPYGQFSHKSVEAIDLSVPVGKPVYSSTPGIVFTSGWGGSYGNWVVVDAQSQGQSFRVIYGHMAATFVSRGQAVNPGTQLGLSGSTGFSTGPHLHYEYKTGVKYNQCPAAGVNVPQGCDGTDPASPYACLINIQRIYGP